MMMESFDRPGITDKSVIGTHPILTPIDILNTYSFEEFECFILEWATTFMNKGFHVLKSGGSQDRGIDILVSNQKDCHIIYQCKKYDKKFNLSDTINELGKILYYSFLGNIPKPTEYYLIAYSGLNEKTISFFNNKEKMGNKIIENWEAYCEKKIILNKSVRLSEELKNYILKFNYSCFCYKGITEILNEHKDTVYFAFRFGDQLTVKRPSYTKPEKHQIIENEYIKKLYDIYSEELGKEIKDDENLKKESPMLYTHLQQQRERFFSAENLRVFAKDSLLLESEFNRLKEDIYDAIFDTLCKANISAYNRLDECLTKASDMAVTDNLLTKCSIVSSKDRKGICHHISNERDDVKWKH